MTIKERAKIASEYKATGKYNCTRAVIAAFEDVIKIDPEEITMLTAGFAAGNNGRYLWGRYWSGCCCGCLN